MKKLILLAAVLVGASMGCSATSLRCGVDGVSSYVELVTNQDVNSLARTFKELCYGSSQNVSTEITP